MPSTSSRRPDRTPGGFTLIEVLVAVGIIVLITSILLPAILYSKTRALVIRARGDLGTIANALDAYKADFQDYPRFVDPSVSQAGFNNPGSGYWLDYQEDRGARLLCRALIGPAGAGTTGVASPGDDGADGPGFRVRRNLAGVGGAQQLSGRVYGPYLQPDKWKLSYDPNPQAANVPSSLMYNAKMLDLYGNPILYYPATPGATARLGLASGFVSSCNPGTFTAPAANATNAPSYPLYNAFDNASDSTPPLGSTASPKVLLDATAMGFILGDRTGNGGAPVPNGKIDAGETAVTTQPYLLWTAGADGVFGFGLDPANSLAGLPAAQFPGHKTDDVCNFDIPPDLRK